jgi:hypothetical protein
MEIPSNGNASIRVAFAAVDAAVLTSHPCWMSNGPRPLGAVGGGAVVGGAVVGGAVVRGTVVVGLVVDVVVLDGPGIVDVVVVVARPGPVVAGVVDDGVGEVDVVVDEAGP